ncbi:MAG TPA: ABC transporter substrate-binding protein [Acidimicrobiia bacterium]|jgi:ABC-type branched-subunit amino acid transport system substrate-binding protein|nr:ABC transporter substrate-binding protein [Acidimicrobiia bacterium]
MGTGGVRFRALIAVVAVLVSAACGQKAGVSGPDAAASPIPAPSAPSTTAVTGGAAQPLPSAPGTTAITAPALARSGPTPTAGGRSAAIVGPTAQVSQAAAARPDPTPAPAPSARPVRGESPPPDARADPHDRDGVSDKEIVIGIHAPLTGAAPVPQDSVEKAKDLYWKFVAEQGGIFGRNVRIVFRDDQFNPSRAVAVCREMVEQEHAFLLVGVGTDQIVSCARYASQVGVPYFSSGGSEAAVAGLRTYFSISMSYPQQAPMVAQTVKKTGKTKVAVVVVNTPNYDDTFASLGAAAKAAGLSVVRADRMGKQATESEVLAEANNLRTSGAEAVLLFLPPVTFLNLAHAAQGQAYAPLWAGPGLSNGINLVAEFGCPSIAGARFLSPFPELDVIDRFDADYKPTYRKYNNGAEPDDLGVLVWGLEKTLHQFLKATGPDLGRARLLATLESGQEFASGVFPPVRFGPGQRFGASQAHLLEADCTNRRYRTLATFASSL